MICPLDVALLDFTSYSGGFAGARVPGVAAAGPIAGKTGSPVSPTGFKFR
jgi:hypothetical protein